jgi:hypothetical protein
MGSSILHLPVIGFLYSTRWRLSNLRHAHDEDWLFRLSFPVYFLDRRARARLACPESEGNAVHFDRSMITHQSGVLDQLYGQRRRPRSLHLIARDAACLCAAPKLEGDRHE